MLALLACIAPAQGASVDLYPPRAFGYFIGDILTLEAVITLDPGFRLEASALPRPRAVTYWLDLAASDLKGLSDRDGRRRYLLRLRYQTFYAPLEPRALEIPAVPLTASDGAARLDISVPAWSFLASPLREIASSRGGDPMALKPDIPPAPYALKPNLLRAGGALGLALAALLALAARRGWGPFAVRRRPFVIAARQMDGILVSRPDPEAYKRALLFLHRAFDQAAGRRLLADDIPRFLAATPALASHEADIIRLFAASRMAFFGAGAERAMANLPPDELLAIARRMAATEAASGSLLQDTPLLAAEAAA